MENLDRRNWLRRSGLAIAGLTIGDKLFSRSIYVPQWDDEAKEIIKISSNENPYGPSKMAMEAMVKAISTSNRYPWEITTQLREKIGELYGLKKDHILMGAGSSELLGVVAAMASREKGNAVAAYPTFTLWFKAAEHFGLSIKNIPCTEQKQHNLEEMYNAIDPETRMVYIVNPHNPTGTIIAAPELEDWINRMTQKCIVLLDEAYTEYSDEPSLGHLVANNKNLVVAKTFSKIYGMAGARAGFVMAHPETIAELGNYMPWANAGTSAVSLAGALASLDDAAFAKMTKTKTNATREMVHHEFTKMNIPFTHSNTSFVYYNTESLKTDLAAACEQANIIGVRTYEKGTSWRRTSLGTMEEMEKFIKVVKKVKGV